MYLVIKQAYMPLHHGHVASSSFNTGPTIHRFTDRKGLDAWLVKNGTENIEVFQAKKLDVSVRVEIKHVD